ncbi:MAG: hypothetical protein ACYC0M_15470 [Burkholderiales bacterium]
MNKRYVIAQAIGTALILALSGCGGGSGSSPATPSTPTSLANAILQAEATGAVPKLNHDNTVLGPDVNGNGIRDDIDLYIAAQPDTPAQKAALSQMAVALQAAMAIDTTNNNARLGVSTKMMNANACLLSVYNDMVGGQKSDDIEKITVDTMTRLHAYEKFNTAESGTVDTAPTGSGCND